jgi:hypothetical protein
MELTDFLQWLVFSGGAVMAFSWIVEQFDGWHTLSDTLKRVYSFAGSAVLALGGWAVMSYAPPELLAALYEPFSVITGIFMSVFLGQQWHSATKEK